MKNPPLAPPKEGIFYTLFFRFSPVLRFKVEGNSMLPGYRVGDVVVVERLWYIKLLQLVRFRATLPAGRQGRNDKIIEVGDVVVARDPRDGRLILKRIKEVNN